MLAMPSNVFYKIFVFTLLATAFSFFALSSSDFNNDATSSDQRVASGNHKYVLLWTPQVCKDCAPFDSFGNGRYAFKRNNCPAQNCFITTNRTLLGDYTNFDAILFNGRSMLNWNTKLPQRRHHKQLYVFVQLESADRFPVCATKFDNFFNRTFTYSLKSDYEWPYFYGRLKNGSIVAPATKVHWLQNMSEVSDDLKRELSKKSKLVAWFVSNCNSRNNREQFARDLQTQLERHGKNVDIYGNCGTLKCPKKSDTCDEYIRNDYYFYLALENSFSEDYVTEKVLTALHNNAVPIVYGGAQYDRFLPPGSYIDGRALGAAKLADEMVRIMGNATLYANMFKWKEHYDFSTVWPPPLCRLCDDLNTEPTHTHTYKQFRKWWFPNYQKRCKFT